MKNLKLRLLVDARFISPYAMSVFVALREKGIAFETEWVDLEAKQNLGPAYRARSPTWRVPTLEHGGLALSESSAITGYLEEVFAPPIYPAVCPPDPIARARARQIQAWLRSDLLPIRDERPTAVIFRKPSECPLSQEARVSANKLFEVAGALLEHRSSSLFGRWCIADTDLALMLNRLVVNGDEVPERLRAYAQHQWARPTVQAWIAQGHNAH